MNFENILFDKKNAIAYVTVNRPKVLNALNMATMEELRAAFHDIKNDASVRVVILAGSGEKAFIAGADISELAKHDAVSGKEYTHRGQSVLNLIENLGKPVIACINGFALGGGCEIAIQLDARLENELELLRCRTGKAGEKIPQNSSRYYEPSRGDGTERRGAISLVGGERPRERVMTGVADVERSDPYLDFLRHQLKRGQLSAPPLFPWRSSVGQHWGED